MSSYKDDPKLPASVGGGDERFAIAKECKKSEGLFHDSVLH
jgi:hypothetical protein